MCLSPTYPTSSLRLRNQHDIEFVSYSLHNFPIYVYNLNNFQLFYLMFKLCKYDTVCIFQQLAFFLTNVLHCYIWISSYECIMVYPRSCQWIFGLSLVWIYLWTTLLWRFFFVSWYFPWVRVSPGQWHNLESAQPQGEMRLSEGTGE